MDLITLHPGSAYARLTWPTPILVGQARELDVTSLTPLFAYSKLGIEQTWTDLC